MSSFLSCARMQVGRGVNLWALAAIACLKLGLAVGSRETVAADLGAGATLLFVPGLRTSGACVPVHRVLAGEFDAEANATRPITAIRFAAAVSNGAA